MWALSPETEGVSCGLGNTTADRLCRDPVLRSMTPRELAHALGVSVTEAQAGILRLAAVATGRPVTGVRGRSFDDAISVSGRTAGRHRVEYVEARGFETDEAGGGFSTPASPTLLPPGITDPRTRSFTAAILNPELVKQYGEAAVKQAGIVGLVPPPEDLDRVAVFAPPPLDWPGQYYQWLDITGQPDAKLPDGSYRSPTWADVQNAGTLIGRPDLNDLAVKSTLAWWRQAYALGPLPEDSQGIDDPRESSFNWPKGTDNTIRRIYFWGFGKDGRLYKHMQVQKVDAFGNFRIFNQNGQNLTFVFHPESGKWIAGWDFGDWFVQNRYTIVKALQLGVTAVMMCLPFASAALGAVASMLFGISQYGLSIGLATAISSAAAAQQAFVAAMVALAKGDLGEAFKYFSSMVADLGQIPINGDASMLPPEFQSFANNPAVKGLATTIAQAGTAEIGAVVQKASELGGTVVKIGQKEIYDARSLVPAELVPWFDRATHEGGAALARRASVPWYAIGIHDFGTTIGVLADPTTVTGIKAPRGHGTGGYIQEKPYEDMTIAELEVAVKQLNDGYARVAQTPYGSTHPNFLANYRQRINEVEVILAVKKNPVLQVTRKLSGGQLSLAQAAFEAKKGGAPPARPAQSSGGGAIAAPIAGGILALLFFL